MALMPQYHVYVYTKKTIVINDLLQLLENLFIGYRAKHESRNGAFDLVDIKGLYLFYILI